MISRIIEAAAEGQAHNPLLPAPADLLWSSVVFVILLAFFWVRVLPNFKKNLDSRTEAIEGRLEAAEKAQAEAAAKTANIEAERQAALIPLRAEVGSLAIDLASSVVGASLKNEKVATGVVDQFLADLEAGDKVGKKK
jgi:F-type H+-transporting ATPase subunit b